MPKLTYALEPNGPKRLEVSWGISWRNTTVRLDGNIIGTIPNQKEMSAGQSFQLPDSSTLQVQLVRSFLSAQLRVLRDGKPLPGSMSDPAARLRQAYGVIFFIGGVNIVGAILGILFQIEILQRAGLGVIAIGVGIVLLVLGFFVRRRSRVALIIAVVLYSLDTLVVILSLTGFNLGIFVRMAFLIGMWQGFGALRDLKEEK